VAFGNTGPADGGFPGIGGLKAALRSADCPIVKRAYLLAATLLALVATGLLSAVLLVHGRSSPALPPTDTPATVSTDTGVSYCIQGDATGQKFHILGPGGKVRKGPCP
jgi:hypothetical protein